MQSGTISLVAIGGLLALLAAGCASCDSQSAEVEKTELAQAEPAVVSKPAVRGDRPHENAACRACREKHCTNYEGLVDLVAACFSNADAELVKQCIAVKNCAYDKRCGYNATGAPECFCGTADLQACLTPGAANGPCQAEWYAAARTKSLAELALRFGDVSLATGIAYHFQACDRDLCKECVPPSK